LGLFEIYQISIGQNKARKTLFINMSAQHFALWLIGHIWPILILIGQAWPMLSC
jgi:hypothetical protein